MTPAAKNRVLWIGLVAALAVVLAHLAVLQYHWAGEVSEAASERLQANLERSLMDIRQDLTRDVARLGLDLQPDREAGLDAKELAASLERWRQTDAHPDLVSNVYVWEATSPGQPFRRLDAQQQQFVPAEWPADLAHLREHLSHFSQAIAAVHAVREHGGPPEVMLGDPHAPGGMAPIWLIDQNAYALAHPVIRRPGPDSPPQVAWLLVTMDPAVLRQHIFPELAERYLSGRNGLVYQVAVVAGHDSGSEVLYASDPGFGRNLGKADAMLNLWGPPFGGPGQPMAMTMMSAPPRDMARHHEMHTRDFVGPIRLEPVRGPEDRDWCIVVQHRKGSLEAAVAGMRRRNLAVGFGVLLVLALTMAIVLIAAHRAQRLAQLQMDFVTGVSHELRTPLAVISSAAENIADGVVEDKQQVAKYGEAIRNQAKQLIQLVEQVLRFASTQQPRANLDLRAVPVSEVVGSAIEATSTLVSQAGMILERRVDPGSPLVLADAGALSQCLQNLITNAVKYGSDGDWIGITAGACHGPAGTAEVRMSVSDHGRGIEDDVMKHIFDPFYRGPSVAGSRVHGSGLGLALVKRFVEAMSGRVTVESEVGKGSEFSIYLPVAGKTASNETSAATAMAESSERSR
jgi:signal transduction histidine kinase